MPRRTDFFALVPVCKIEGCSGEAASRGLCATHYARYRANGWLEIVGNAPRIEREGTVAAKTSKVLDKLHEQIGLYATARPAEFEALVRSLGYYVTPAGRG